MSERQEIDDDGGPPIDARPLMMPDATPTPKLTSRDGFGGSRTPRQISQTENAMTAPIARRTGLAGSTVRISNPIGTPQSRPGNSARTARQSQSSTAARSPATPMTT